MCTSQLCRKHFQKCVFCSSYCNVQLLLLFDKCMSRPMREVFYNLYFNFSKCVHIVWTCAFSNVKKYRDHYYVITIGLSYTLKKLYSSSTYRVCKTLKYRPNRFSLAFIYAYLKGPNINIFLCLVYCFTLGLLHRFRFTNFIYNCKYTAHFKINFQGGWMQSSGKLFLAFGRPIFNAYLPCYLVFVCVFDPD